MIGAFVDALALSGVTLVVHDWGGPIGLATMQQRPEIFDRLVLSNHKCQSAEHCLFEHRWVAGKIAVAAIADGLLVRVGAARAEELVRTTAAQPMEMGERTMRGWVHIDGEHLRSRRRLGEWIDIGIAAATNA